MAKKNKEKTSEDLKKALKEKCKDLRLFRFSVSGSKIKNVKEGSNSKKEIARILTELKARSK